MRLAKLDSRVRSSRAGLAKSIQAFVKQLIKMTRLKKANEIGKV